MASPGLVLVGTPLGNLGDLSQRGRDALAAADVIACEDTRRTGNLLALLGIPSPRLLVVNEYTESDMAPEVVGSIRDGKRVVLCSDAGMPGISDPGERIVRAALDAGLSVEVVPGPTAAATALVLSGLPVGRHVFEGFLPRKGSARHDRLAEVAAEARTVVLYEAPHRLARTLGDLAAVCGPERRIVLARELTKLHEECWRGTLADAIAHVDVQTPRGEYVLVLEGVSSRVEVTDDELVEAIGAARARGSSTRDAVDEVATVHDVSRSRVYRLAHQ